MATTKHIAISAAAFSGNQGAASMLHATIQQLSNKHQNIDFAVFTVYPVGDAEVQNYKNVILHAASPKQLVAKLIPAAFLYRLFPFMRNQLIKIDAIKALSKADLQIDLAGISFADGRGIFLLYNIASVLPALLMKVPVVKFAQAMGPFKDPLARFVAKMFLPFMDHVFSRGAVTATALKKIKLSNTSRASDVAFLFKPTEKDENANEKLLKNLKLRKHGYVLFAPSQVLYKKANKLGIDYIKESADFIQWVITNKQLPVLLVAHSVRQGTSKRHNNDIPVCQEIFDSLPKGSDCYFPAEPLYAGQLKQLIGSAKLVVTARFHAMISSLATRVPVVVTGWSHKYQEVLDELDVSVPTVYLEKDFTQQVQKSVANIIDSNNEDFFESVDKSIGKVKDSARKQINYVTAKIF